MRIIFSITRGTDTTNLGFTSAKADRMTLGEAEARDEIDMTALHETMEKIHHQAKHMGQGQHAHHTIAGLQECEAINTELEVAPQRGGKSSRL